MEKAVLVGVRFKGDDPAVSLDSLAELKRLLETAGGVVGAVMVQERVGCDPATYVGEGKARELAGIVLKEKCSVVVVDHDLSPSQQKNLQDIVPAKIIDRTRLILDIFAQRARSREGKLQVELAQLSYNLPRITEKYGRFEQQTGGIGTRGPGERKLDVSQRRARDRITRLKKEMEAVRRQRSLRNENRQRTPWPLVALAGYTNAGKSSLLNALRAPGGDDLYADDALFATLDPTTRRVKLPGGGFALFVDTVGFIQRLPHHLVVAFRATIEEAMEADLLVHVVDAASSARAEQQRVVEEVFAELGADSVPRLTVFNKADLLTVEERGRFKEQGRLLCSAVTPDGRDELLRAVEALVEKDLKERTFLLPHGRRDLLPVIYGAGRVVREKPTDDGVLLTVRLDDKNWGRVQKMLEG